MTEAESRALTIISQGEPFEESWCEDGDGESGPMGGTIFGYRSQEDGGYADECVELTRNGSVIVQNGNGDRPEMIHNSHLIRYTGIGAMIADHLRSIESNAIRNGLEFVKTGRRPKEGHYSLVEILKREAAMNAGRS